MMAESRIIVLIEGQAHEARAVEERNPVRPSYVIRDVGVAVVRIADRPLASVRQRDHHLGVHHHQIQLPCRT